MKNELSVKGQKYKKIAHICSFASLVDNYLQFSNTSENLNIMASLHTLLHKVPVPCQDAALSPIPETIFLQMHSVAKDKSSGSFSFYKALCLAAASQLLGIWLSPLRVWILFTLQSNRAVIKPNCTKNNAN